MVKIVFHDFLLNFEVLNCESCCQRQYVCSLYVLSKLYNGYNHKNNITLTAKTSINNKCSIGAFIQRLPQCKTSTPLAFVC